MQTAVLLQSFNGDARVVFDAVPGNRAGAHCTPVEGHRARTTLTIAAAVLAADRIQLIAQHVQQRAVGVNLYAVSDAVDLKLDDCQRSRDLSLLGAFRKAC